MIIIIIIIIIIIVIIYTVFRMHYPLPQCVYRNMKDVYHGVHYNQYKNVIIKYKIP